MAKPEIDALRNPRCGAALGKDHVSGASCDFPTGHSCAHGVNSRKDEPQRRVVAECRTCAYQNHVGRIHGLTQRSCDCPTVARLLTGRPMYIGDTKWKIEEHRAAGHDVREVKPS